VARTRSTLTVNAQAGTVKRVFEHVLGDFQARRAPRVSLRWIQAKFVVHRTRSPQARFPTRPRRDRTTPRPSARGSVLSVRTPPLHTAPAPGQVPLGSFAPESVYIRRLGPQTANPKPLAMPGAIPAHNSRASRSATRRLARSRFPGREAQSTRKRKQFPTLRLSAQPTRAGPPRVSEHPFVDLHQNGRRTFPLASISTIR
jgi:hypothetical protein